MERVVSPPVSAPPIAPGETSPIMTPLVGRDADLAAAGPAHAWRCATCHPDRCRGIGKTRLALSVAAVVAEAFGDRAWPAATASTPESVATEIAHAIGIADTGGAPSFDALKGALRDERLLLVIDNFEQAVAAAPLVSDLLRRCPEVSILVTSRALLRIDGEHPIHVPPLAMEPVVAGAGNLSGLSPAAQLFTQRATEVAPGFAATPENTPVISEICRRRDGLPLAIELAAERVQAPPADLLARLGRRLPHLTAGRRDRPSRHRTMRCHRLSYDLLTPTSTGFRCLSVFAEVPRWRQQKGSPGGHHLGRWTAAAIGRSYIHGDRIPGCPESRPDWARRRRGAALSML